MALTAEQMVLTGVLALVAVATPLVVLLAPDPVVPPPPPARAVAFDAPPPLDAALRRALFAPAAPPESYAEEAADAPALVGIAGRLNVDAVALVRTSDGTTRTLAVGEGVDGWELKSLAIDAAFFTRGGQAVRVPMPEE